MCRMFSEPMGLLEAKIVTLSFHVFVLAGSS
jgi:hypothetical protein